MQKLRVGVIGAGSIAMNMHLKGLSALEDVELTAVCDLVEAKARAAADAFGFARVYTLHPEMLDREELDAVFVLTEPDRICRPVLDALESGRDVFMEKPPGITAFQAHTLRRAADDTGRILMVGFNRRYISLVQRVMEIMHERTAISQVVGRFMKCTSAAFCRGMLGSFESDVIHSLDLIRWAAGGEAEAGALVEGRTEDVCPNRWNGVIRFDNGVTGVILSNYQTGGRVHTLEVHGPGASAYVNLGFSGLECEARLLFAGKRQAYSIAAGGAGDDSRMDLNGAELAGSHDVHILYGFMQEDREFVQCVRERRLPSSCIADAAKSMDLVDLLRAGRL